MGVPTGAGGVPTLGPAPARPLGVPSGPGLPFAPMFGPETRKAFGPAYDEQLGLMARFYDQFK